MSSIESNVALLNEMLTPEQRELAHGSKAWSNPDRVMGHPLGTSPFQMTGHFHMVMKMVTPEFLVQPSVSMRERRARLILEEFLELMEAMGFTLMIDTPSDGPQLAGTFNMGVEHIEGSRYDVVETADALGDLNVVVNGTAVEFGIPEHLIDYEVYCSNLSKADAGGEVIVNHCTKCGPDLGNIYLSTCDCGNEDSFLKAGVPIGKILKGESFVPANIPAVLMAYAKEEL